MNSRPLLWLGLVLALPFCACAHARSVQPTAPESPTEAVLSQAEPSTRPGVNKRFLSDDLDVERFSKIFEGESREIFTSRSALVDTLELSPGAVVADVGAGTGLFEPLFSEAVGPNGHVFAVDISPRFIEHLHARIEREALTNVEVVLGGERTIGVAPGSLDAAFVCDTYHHFEYPKSMLDDLHRAIRPGGTLIIVDFERIPGQSPEWILDHVRADKATFKNEIEAAGFVLSEEVSVPGLSENYVLRFQRM